MLILFQVTLHLTHVISLFHYSKKWNKVGGSATKWNNLSEPKLSSTLNYVIHY